MFFRSRDWGTHQKFRIEEKLNAPKYWDSLYENPVQSIQNLRLGRRFTFQQNNDPKHTARVAYRQLCECPWVAQPQPGIEPNQIFLEKPENVRLPHPTWKSLRDEEVRRRMVDNCQMLMSKACHIIPKNTWGCKGASAKYWIKGLNTYGMYVLIFYFFIHLQSCDSSVFDLSLWCIGRYRDKNKCKAV